MPLGGGTYWSNVGTVLEHVAVMTRRVVPCLCPMNQVVPAATSCSGVRDNGWAGGDALIRIKYIES